MNRGSLLRGLPCTLLLLVASACTKAPTPTPAGKPSADKPAPKPADKPADTPGEMQKGEPFAQVDAWDGPAARSEHNFASKQIVLHFAAPTAAYAATLDEIVVEGGVRKIKVTLLQPASDAVVATVVTDTACVIDEAKLAGKEPMQVVVRRMQKGAQYLVAPPWVLAMTQS